MTVSAYLEILHEDNKISPAPTGSADIAAKAFALRRANYFDEAGCELLLSAGQQQALINLVKGGDFNVKQKMIAHNLRLVVDVAQHYTNRGLAFMDLINAGITGLIHALEKFEREGGFRFSTYAKWCVRENIERAILNQNNCLPGMAL